MNFSFRHYERLESEMNLRWTKKFLFDGFFFLILVFSSQIFINQQIIRKIVKLRSFFFSFFFIIHSKLTLFVSLRNARSSSCLLTPASLPLNFFFFVFCKLWNIM